MEQNSDSDDENEEEMPEQMSDAGMGLDNCLYFICLYFCLYFQNCLFIKAKIWNAFIIKAISKVYDLQCYYL